MLTIDEQTRERLLAKLKELAERHRTVEARLADPELASDHARLSQLAREHGRLARFAEAYGRLEQARRRIAEARRTIQ